MDAPEAAASLFGPEDTSADPFAVIGADGAQDGTATSSTQGDAGFLAETTQEGPFDYQQSYIAGGSIDTYANSSVNWDSYSSTTEVVSNSQQYSTHVESSSTAQYEPVSSYSNGYNAGTTYAPAANTTSQYNPSSYLPPAPQPTQPVNTWQAQSAATADRYAPAPQPTGVSNYDPYSPYSHPATTSQYPSYGTPAYSAPPPPPATTYSKPEIPAPAPPSVPKPLDRPKVSNAYDPPFPTTSRRSGRASVPAQQAYGAYTTYQSPLASTTAPPMPPPARATPPPPKASSHYGTYQAPLSSPPPQARATPPPPRAHGNYAAHQAAPLAAPPARATPPPRPVYSDTHSSAPNAYAPKANVVSPPTNSLPLQPPANGHANSYEPYEAPTYAQSPPKPDHAPLQSPPLAKSEAHQWSAEQNLVPSDTETSALDQTFGGGDSFNDFDPEGSSMYPASPNHPETNLTVQSASLNASDTGASDAYSPYAPPAADQDMHKPASPELSRESAPASPPQANTYVPGPNASVSITNTSATAMHRAESPASFSRAYDHPSAPLNDYSRLAQPPRRTDSPVSQPESKPPGPPPRNVYSPPLPQRRDTIQRDKQFAPERSVHSSGYSPFVPVTSGYEPPSVPASDSTNHVQSAYNLAQDYSSPSSTTLNATSMAYAPSPSLLGSNDPLARTTARAPLINFGFGGRLVTCFHGAATLNTGFDVALANRNTTSVKVYSINKLLPPSALESSEVAYPGPLFPDVGSAAINLVRSAAAAQSKGKKTRVVKYLEDRAAEITQGLSYQSPQDSQASEAKVALINVLKALVENDGQLLTSSQSEPAVRAALVPGVSTEDNLALPDAMSPALYSAGPTINSFEAPISVTTLTSSALNKIEELLVRGERRKAYTYALDQKLWAHAMVIASSIDKEAWKEVVNDFIHTELASQDDPPHSAAKLPGGNPLRQAPTRREGLRAAYSLFSGQGAAAVKELVPTKLISLASGLQPPNMMVPSTTPRTPAFPPSSFTPAAPATPPSLSQWKETAAMMISCPLSQDASTALTALGDQLLSYGWVEAAHTCYILSPQTSPLGGVGSPSARLTVVGSKAPLVNPLFSKDPDVFILSEILEFALSLPTVAKGQEPFPGIPHLQPYRLLRAFALAETGEIALANRYVEAISASLGKGSPYFTPTFVGQLKDLTERINGVALSEKSASWIGAKISKPSLDTIGGWLEGRFTKLVTGEGDGETQEEESKKAAQRTFDGPFAHYSTISNSPSARSSPQPTHHNPYAPPHRTSSAMAMSSSFLPPQQQPIDRASSAIDYLRDHKPGRQSPAPAFGYGAHPNYSTPALALNTASHPKVSAAKQHTRTLSTDTKPSPDGELETPVQGHGGGSWWDYSSGQSQTPTAATFMQVEEPVVQESGSGFISLMDNDPYTIQPKAPSAPPAPMRVHDFAEDDEEDLGFGNRKPSTKPPSPEGGARQEPAKPAEPAPAPKAEPPAKQPALGQQPAAGGGWLSRWWKGSTSEGGSGPVQVKLGQENSFYYDKDLKRWVNKNSGPGEAKPAPTPPPPRAATASPSKAASMMRPPHPSSSAPPQAIARAASAMDFSSNIPDGRVRSSLVPPDTGAPPPMGGSRPPSVRPPSAASGGPPGPPGSRPRSQATKRNVRSRYVDVFQQENPAS